MRRPSPLLALFPSCHAAVMRYGMCNFIGSVLYSAGHAGKPHFFESVAFFDGAMDATVLFARGCADRVRGGRKAACVAGLFPELQRITCMAVISLLFRNRSASQTAFCTERIKNTSSIYLRQHKSAQLSAADTVESIAPPILSHILTAYNNCVPGKGELEGEKRASQL